MNSTAIRFLFVLALTVASAFAQNNFLTNDDVVQMTKAGFDQNTIVKAIETSKPSFDTSAQALLSLKAVNVTDTVITAMLSAGDAKAVNASGANVRSTAAVDAMPTEVGIFLKKGTHLIEVDPEIVNWRTGGVLKMAMSGGLMGGHINGSVRNPHSRVFVSVPAEFLIRCPENVAASEYQLLKLHEKGDRREFRTLTGGAMHASGGSDRDAINFDFDKVAPRTYRVRLAELKKGEYGFLGSGKLFTFSVE